jgi:ATP-dependent Clp protease protease subunit
VPHRTAAHSATARHWIPGPVAPYPEPTARHVLPEFTERTSLGARTTDPYSRLLQDRIVLLGTPVDDESANSVMAQLLQLESAAPDQDVWLYINSPGGSLTAMTAVYDTMRYVSCDVGTVCVGQAASAAAVLLAAGAPGKRLATPRSRVLIHRPSLAEPVHGRVDDLELTAREILRGAELQVRLLTEHTGQDEARVRADLERDTVLDAPAAVAYGLVDGLTRSRRAPLAAV